jgi:hypothetical protein
MIQGHCSWILPGKLKCRRMCPVGLLNSPPLGESHATRAGRMANGRYGISPNTETILRLRYISKNLTMISFLRWANLACSARLFKGMVVLEWAMSPMDWLLAKLRGAFRVSLLDNSHWSLSQGLTRDIAQPRPFNLPLLCIPSMSSERKRRRKSIFLV